MSLPPVLVTIPITETPDQRKAREKRGEPLPHFSYVAHSEGYKEPVKRDIDNDAAN